MTAAPDPYISHTPANSQAYLAVAVHWRERAVQAETELDATRQALQQIADADTDGYRGPRDLARAVLAGEDTT